MIIDPFELERTDEKKIAAQMTELLKECEDKTDSVQDLLNTVGRLSDAMILCGEIYTRRQSRYLKIKLQNKCKEKELAQKLKDESNEKQPASYYADQAMIMMLDEYDKEIDAKLQAERFDLYNKATNEKINALKKKIDSRRFDM